MANQNLSTETVIIHLLSLHIVWVVCIREVKLPSRRFVKVIKASHCLRSHSLCDVTFLWLLSSAHYEERQMLTLSLSESFPGVRFCDKVLSPQSPSKLVAVGCCGREILRNPEGCFRCLVLGVWVRFKEGGCCSSLAGGSLCGDVSASEQCGESLLVPVLLCLALGPAFPTPGSAAQRVGVAWGLSRYWPEFRLTFGHFSELWTVFWDNFSLLGPVVVSERLSVSVGVSGDEQVALGHGAEMAPKQAALSAHCAPRSQPQGNRLELPQTLTSKQQLWVPFV